MQIPVVRNVLEANEKMADNVRRLLTEKGILSLNLISSPGAGKTTLLERTIEAMRSCEEGIQQEMAQLGLA